MELLPKLITKYLVVINVITLCLFTLDKIKAKKNKSRIREKKLLLLIILGGIIGSVLGMKVINHKKNKKEFIYLTYISTVIWIIIIIKVLKGV